MKVKAQQYRQMNREELESSLEELQQRLFELRSQAVTENLGNSQAVKNIKRDIARVKTVLRESEIHGK